MPFMQIYTSVSRSKIPADLTQLVAKTLSSTLKNKPLERIVVHIAPDELMFSGSSPKGQTAYAILRSIGSVTADDNRLTTVAITDLLHEKLGLPKSEIRIIFNDLPPEMVALAGKIISDA